MFDKNKFMTKEDIEAILRREILKKNGNTNIDLTERVREIYLAIQNNHRNERNNNLRNKRLKYLLAREHHLIFGE